MFWRLNIILISDTLLLYLSSGWWSQESLINAMEKSQNRVSCTRALSTWCDRTALTTVLVEACRCMSYKLTIAAIARGSRDRIMVIHGGSIKSSPFMTWKCTTVILHMFSYWFTMATDVMMLLLILLLNYHYVTQMNIPSASSLYNNLWIYIAVLAE